MEQAAVWHFGAGHSAGEPSDRFDGYYGRAKTCHPRHSGDDRTRTNRHANLDTNSHAGHTHADCLYGDTRGSDAHY